MKLTLVGPVYPYRGGISHYTTQLAFALEKEGIETRVISFRRQYLNWLYPGNSDKDPSKQVLQVDADFILDPIYPWTWFQAAKRVTIDQPQLVLVQWWTTFWAIPLGFFIRALRHENVRVAILVHNVLPHERKLWDKPLATWALSTSQRFVTQTQAQKECLLSLIPTALIEVCSHPVYTMFSGDYYSQKEARNLLDLPLDRSVLLFFGIVRRYKGLHCLLEALSNLPASRRPLLIIAGEFWEDQERYQHQIRQLNLSGDVRIDNRYIPNEEVSKLFLAADMLIAPYLFGTQSGAVGIALYFGLPMIISNIVAQGIRPEYLSRTRIFPAGDVQALTKILYDVIDTPRNTCVRQSAPSDWGRLVGIIQRLATRLPS